MTDETNRPETDECTRVPGDRLADLRDGLLTEEELQAVEEHLAGCPDCAARARDVDRLAAALTEGDREVPVPPAVDESIRRMAREAAARVSGPARARPHRLLRWAAAACLLLGVFGGGLVLGRSDLLNGDRRRQARDQAETLMDTRAQVRGLLAELSAQKAEAAASIRSLRTELDGALSRNVALAETMETSAANETRLRKQVASLTAEVATQGKEVNRLGELFEKTLEQGRDRVASVKREYEEVVAFVQKQLDRERQNKARLEAEVRERRAATAKLEARVAKLEAGPGRRGDFNGDGRTDVVDAMAICHRLTQGGAVDYAEQADLNGDGKVDVGDALLIAGLTFGGKGQ